MLAASMRTSLAAANVAFEQNVTCTRRKTMTIAHAVAASSSSVNAD